MSLELPGSIRDVSVEISSDGRECTVTINPQKYCYNPKVMTGVKLDRGHVLFYSRVLETGKRNRKNTNLLKFLLLTSFTYHLQRRERPHHCLIAQLVGTCVPIKLVILL